jgi:hypothetical protein
VLYFHEVGVWRSLVAHLHGVQGVPSSNPGTPTKENERAGSFASGSFFGLACVSGTPLSLALYAKRPSSCKRLCSPLAYAVREIVFIRPRISARLMPSCTSWCVAAAIFLSKLLPTEYFKLVRQVHIRNLPVINNCHAYKISICRPNGSPSVRLLHLFERGEVRY